MRTRMTSRPTRDVLDPTPLHPGSLLTWSVALRRRMSERDSEGISTLMRRMLPHGSVRTAIGMAGRQTALWHVRSGRWRSRAAGCAGELGMARGGRELPGHRSYCGRGPLAMRTRGDDVDGLKELVKGVLRVLPRQHQQAAVALLLQRRHLLAQLRLGEGRALRNGGVGRGRRRGTPSAARPRPTRLAKTAARSGLSCRARS